MQQITTDEVFVLLFQKLSLLPLDDALQLGRLDVVRANRMLDVLGTCQVIALFRGWLMKTHWG